MSRHLTHQPKAETWGEVLPRKLPCRLLDQPRVAAPGGHVLASATTERRERLKTMIRAIFAESDATYGHRRIHAVIVRSGYAVSLELIRRLVRELGLVTCHPRPYRPTTTLPAADTAATPDLVGRDFTADAPGVKFVGDITYIRTMVGFVYLATMIDCATKECVGYAIADHLRTHLILASLNMAVRNGRVRPDAIVHSDRGCQCTSAAYAARTDALQLRHSLGRTGICFDNAAAESFNAILKKELVHRTVYHTHADAVNDVTRWIETRYNTRRLHSALGYRTPREAANS